MIIRFTRTITLSSGNEARNFRFHNLGYGRVQATYEYTDRRRNHQTARRFTVEFLNGKVESIVAHSARGGRVECFSTSTILAELNGLDIDDKFREYFDFEDYWHNNGGETITTSYGVYMVDTKGLAYWLKELAAY